jgi:histidine triad (HIT) family protein
MLSQEQTEQIKQQLIAQIGGTSLSNKEEIKESVIRMNPEQLEEFLKQNKLIKTQQSSSQTPQCIFCSIISGNTKSYKIDENKHAIAVLEVNPISKGHSLVIPKEHISSSEKIPQAVFSLAKKIAKKIKTKFKPKDVSISSSNLFGHEIINVLPIYENETLNSEKYQAKTEELEKLQKSLEKKQKPKTLKKPKIKKIEEKLWLPRRIP